MLTIIHGDDTNASRAKLNSLLTDIQWVSRLSDKNSFAEIETALDSTELFLESKTIVIENTAKLGKKVDTLIMLLKKIEKDDSIRVYIWQDAVLSKKFTDVFKSAQFYVYPLPKYFFQFLDSLAPHQGRSLHSLLFKLYPQFEAEQVLYSLAKRVRQLMIFRSGSSAEFEETRAMSSWQVSKLTKQSRMWTEAQLIQFYEKLFDLEFSQKTGGLTMPLIHHIDILLISRL